MRGLKLDNLIRQWECWGPWISPEVVPGHTLMGAQDEIEGVYLTILNRESSLFQKMDLTGYLLIVSI